MEFLEELRNLKDQLRFNKTFDVSPTTKNVVIAGMGGSGIVAKIFQELYTKMPVYTVDDYNLPDFVNKETLLIAISYSGNTEETLSVVGQAIKRDVKVVGITSGGVLEKAADQVVKVPSGIQPRSALGVMLIPIIRSFNAFPQKDIDEAYLQLKQLDNNNRAEQQMAKEIAKDKSIPVIYGTMPYKAVAYRWKTQFNENAKILAYANSFPELNHNDTMALRDTYRKKEFYFIVLSDGKHERVEKRIPITQQITKTDFKMVGPSGISEFAKTMSLIHKGDYVTYHLARMIKKNPVDVSAIEDLKKKLAKAK